MRVSEPPPTPSVRCPGCEPVVAGLEALEPLVAAGNCSETDIEPLAEKADADVNGAGSTNVPQSEPGRCEAADVAAGMETVVGTCLVIEISEAGSEASSASSKPGSQPFEAVVPVTTMENGPRGRELAIEAAAAVAAAY